MTEDSYKIIIIISHNTISFEYYLRGGDDRVSQMPGGSWPAPLVLYCKPNGKVVIGKEAEGAANAGTQNTFKDYFNLIRQQDIFYTIGPEKKPVSKLLLDGAETIFRDFFSSILLNREGSLHDNRHEMPLAIVCQSDIKPHEKSFLYNTFRDAGYHNVSVSDYDTYIGLYIKDSLSKSYPCSKVLSVWSEYRDLSLTLFDVNNTTHPIEKTYSGMGMDPRLDFVIEQIWNDIIAQDRWLEKAAEYEIMKIAAESFLNSSDSVVDGEILTSNGLSRYRYCLRRSNLDFLNSKESVNLQRCVESFMRENDVDHKQDVLLILRGTAANNEYFTQSIGTGFKYVLKSDEELRQEVLKLIIEYAFSHPGIPVDNPKPKEVFLEEEQQKHDKPINSSRHTVPPIPQTLTPQSKSESAFSEKAVPESVDSNILTIKEKREVRETLVEVKQETARGKISKATKLLDKVKETIEHNSDQFPNSTLVLYQEVKKLMGEIKPSKDVSTPPPPPKEAPDRKATKEKNSPFRQEDTEARKWMEKREFIKAKDIYRSIGNEKMASLCSDLNRAWRQYKLLLNQFDNCVKNRNIAIAKKAILEINGFIDLLQQVKLDFSEEKLLQNKYKTIK